MWTPPKDWLGQDAFIIGGGSSLRKFDFKQLKGANTIGCNNAFRLGPEICKICLFGDASYFERTKWELEKFEGQVVSCAPSVANYQVPWIKKMARVRDGLHIGNVLGWNYSTGAAAVNLAISLGADQIYLLGFDMRNSQKDGKTHWHDAYPKPTTSIAFTRFLRGFDNLNTALKDFPNVNVYNVGDGTSDLRCFKLISFQEMEERRRK